MFLITSFIILLFILKHYSYDLLILITYLILILCFLIIILWNLKNYYKKSKKALNIFLERVENAFNNNNVIVSEIFKFDRMVKVNNKRIPLGLLIIDENHKQIFIYETFWSKDERLICLPDIRVFKYDDLIKCKIMFKNKELKISEFRKMFKIKIIKKEYKNILLVLEIKNHFFEKIMIRLSSINNLETFFQIYHCLTKIIQENKKIA